MITRSFRIAGFAGLLAASGSFAAAALVTQPVDDHNLVTLTGNTRPEAVRANDRGAVDPAMTLDHLELQLKRSPAAEAEVERFTAAQHDPASPEFHHWLTAAEFGQRFGAAEADIVAVRAWLSGHGFRVGPVYPGGMVIDFSGTAAQVATAFNAPIHHLAVNGQAHFANMDDPRIPAALAPVVAGIVKLNDFRPHRMHRPRPAYTGTCDSTDCWLVAPADLATIYDFNPLFTATSPITGSGQTIAVVEDTNLYSDTDWTNFRQIFGLSGYGSGSFATIHPPPPAGAAACSNPGVNSDGDDVEAALDAEWSSAAAPGAAIVVASCDNSATIDGVRQALHDLIVSASPPPIISVSYGICEAENGAAANAAFASMYQQADAEGISVFVATGDSGPEDCAPDFTSPARFGIGVNAWASTAHNVAVGGTDFSDTFAGTDATYWGPSTGAPWGTAKSYVPEMAWNDTCASDQLTAFYGFAKSYGHNGFCNSSQGSSYLGTGGGEGGPSRCASGTPSISGVVGGSCQGRPKPAYQKHLLGMPPDGVRDVPDVSMFAADGVWGHQYLLCFSDSNNFGAPCDPNQDPAIWGQGGGGTSYATPIVAGIQALVNEKTGSRQGNPNHVYYSLARMEYGQAGNSQCVSGAGSGTGCVFHDVVTGNDAQDCKGLNNCFRPSGSYGVMSRSDTDYRPAFETGVGYDRPTGIGTIDAANLVNAWASGEAALKGTATETPAVTPPRESPQP
ncbi:MAG TPA: S53 family peptidase [Stellaceae bacterium]|nr:S53 family peptidase [Stellaceae bacterium]